MYGTTGSSYEPSQCESVELAHRRAPHALFAAAKGQSNGVIACQLDLCEGTVRYHVAASPPVPSTARSQQRRRAAAYPEAIQHWVAGHIELANLAALDDWLAAEHDYAGSLRSVHRFVREAYLPPPRRAR